MSDRSSLPAEPTYGAAPTTAFPAERAWSFQPRFVGYFEGGEEVSGSVMINKRTFTGPRYSTALRTVVSLPRRGPASALPVIVDPEHGAGRLDAEDLRGRVAANGVWMK